MSQNDPREPADEPAPAPATTSPTTPDPLGRTAAYNPGQARTPGPALPFTPGPASSPATARAPAPPAATPPLGAPATPALGAPATPPQQGAGWNSRPAMDSVTLVPQLSPWAAAPPTPTPWAPGGAPPSAPTGPLSPAPLSPAPLDTRSPPESGSPAATPARERAPLPASLGTVPPRETVELAFFGPGTPARVRKQRAWTALLEDVEVPPEAEDIEDELPPGRRPAARDRLDVLAVLTRAPAIGPEGVAAAAAQAAGEHGAFTPPLVVATGELEVLFEELDTLKAAVAAVTPLVGGDKRLKDTVDGIYEMMRTPWIQGAPSVVEGLTAQVREAFAQARRALPASYLDEHVERMLLAHRNYQRRVVWGQTRIRCALTGPGAREAVTAYLPETVARELPAVRRMKVRMIAEIRGHVEAEGGPWALRALALGRVVGK